jgi:hypothetical protein
MRITFTRTGGLAGLVRPPVTLDTSKMKRADSARWEKRVHGFFDLPAALPSPKRQPDRFHYTITVEHDDGRSHTIKASEETLPKPLFTLIEALQDFARNQSRDDAKGIG